ncbi:MAG: hypothetical protein ACNA7O_14645 [Rhodobacterales bacterium]
MHVVGVVVAAVSGILDGMALSLTLQLALILTLSLALTLILSLALILPLALALALRLVILDCVIYIGRLLLLLGLQVHIDFSGFDVDIRINRHVDRVNVDIVENKVRVEVVGS